MLGPSLEFKFDPEFDAIIAWQFYNSPNFAGVNFWQKGALDLHEGLRGMDDMPAGRRREFLLKYTQSHYQDLAAEFAKRKKEIELLYRKEEERFFLATENIFPGYLWPQGKYSAYLSIFDFCPRFLEDKSFFVFMYDQDRGILYTIIHEMLHFIFYDYCLAKYPNIFKSLDTEQGAFWELAEIFNEVVQQDPGFTKIHGPVGNIGYPALEPYMRQASQAWQGNVDSWLADFGLPFIKRPL